VGLDSESAHELVAVVGRHNNEYGLTVVAATHDPIAAQRAERIVRLEGGLIASDEASVKRTESPN
jgi:putative ABC transport system ATP-binding protein